MTTNAVATIPKGQVIAAKDYASHPGMTVDQLEVFLEDAREQPNWRQNAEIEADYYDGNQIDAATLAEMENRGLAPLIVNYIQPTINVVLGMEAKARTDWAVRADKPGDKEGEQVALALSVKLKEAERLSNADRAISDAYAHQAKVGLGWVEVARESDPFKPRYRVKAVHRREIWWDWRAQDPDLLDARYLFRRKWHDEDVLCALFPQHAYLIRQTIAGFPSWDPERILDTGLLREWQVARDTSIETSEWRDGIRRRACLYEVWYRVWCNGYVLRLPNGRVVEYDQKNPMHVQSVAYGLIQPEPAVYSKVRLSWWIGPHRVADVPSPYPHNYFPYVPFWGYREDRTNVPYGLIRSMKGPQDEVNARRQKMMWLLSAKRVITDDDAVKNKDHRSVMEEVARPDAYIILDQNRKNKDGFRVESDFALSTQQFQVMQESKQSLQDAGGIYQSLQGKKDTGADSGIAISQLIEQGTTTLAEINDNYRFARRLVGELLMSLVAEDLNRQENVPVVVERDGGRKERVTLNQPTIDAMGNRIRTNDVLRTKTMVELDDIPSTPTYRAELLRQLVELVKGLPPQVQGVVMDIVIEATDLPNRRALADRVRQVAGIPKNPEDMTDEERAAYEEQMRTQRTLNQAQMALLTGQVEELGAKIEKILKDAELVEAKTEQTRVQTERQAIESAHYAREPEAFRRAKPEGPPRQQ